MIAVRRAQIEIDQFVTLLDTSLKHVLGLRSGEMARIIELPSIATSGIVPMQIGLMEAFQRTTEHNSSNLTCERNRIRILIACECSCTLVMPSVC